MHDHVQILTDLYDRLSNQYALDARDDPFFADAPHSRLADGANTHLCRRDWVTGFGEIGHGLTNADSHTCAAAAPFHHRFNLATGRVHLRRLSNYLRTHGLRQTVKRSLQEIKRIGGR